MRRGVAEQVNAIGVMDAVIHNAGIHRSASRDTTPEGHAKTVAVNTLAPYMLTAPNSNATPDMIGTYTTRDIAERIAARFGAGAEVNDKLRFRQPMQSASSGGGSRDQLELARAMRMPSGPKPSGVPILIDDVMTTGAHMRAARTVLRGRGIIVEHGIVCGRTLLHQAADPFALQDEDLDEAFFGVLAG